MQLKPVFGVRSPVHSIARMTNPSAAPHIFTGIFHSAYLTTHQQAHMLLGDKSSAVFHGEAGEAERDPDRKGRLYMTDGNEAFVEEWPGLFQATKHEAETSLDPQILVKVWRGDLHHEYGEAAVTATMACAIKLSGRASDQDEATALARQWWQARKV